MAQAASANILHFSPTTQYALLTGESSICPIHESGHASIEIEQEDSVEPRAHQLDRGEEHEPFVNVGSAPEAESERDE
jgi:hypothetical protein